MPCVSAGNTYERRTSHAKPCTHLAKLTGPYLLLHDRWPVRSALVVAVELSSGSDIVSANAWADGVPRRNCRESWSWSTLKRQRQLAWRRVATSFSPPLSLSISQQLRRESRWSVG
eukprot:3937872-Rhodomonas_salina.2